MGTIEAIKNFVPERHAVKTRSKLPYSHAPIEINEQMKKESSELIFFSMKDDDKPSKYSISSLKDLGNLLPNLQTEPFHYADLIEVSRLNRVMFGEETITERLDVEIEKFEGRAGLAASLPLQAIGSRTQEKSSTTKYKTSFNAQKILNEILAKCLNSGALFLHLDKCCIKAEDEQYFTKKMEDIARNSLSYLLTSFGEEAIAKLKAEIKEKVAFETKKRIESKNGVFVLIEGDFNLSCYTKNDKEIYRFQLEHPLSQFINSKVFISFSIDKEKITERIRPFYDLRVDRKITLKVVGNCWIDRKKNDETPWEIDMIPTAIFR